MPRSRTGSVTYVPSKTRPPGRYRTRQTMPDGTRRWMWCSEICEESPENKVGAETASREIAQAIRERWIEREVPAPAGETMTEYAERWTADRERRGLKSGNDRSIFRVRVEPVLGLLSATGIRAFLTRIPVG